MQTQPFDTYQELIYSLLKRVGIVDDKQDIIPVSKDEMEMYKSYTWPQTKENPNPVYPETIKYKDYILLEVDDTAYEVMKEELKMKGIII